MILRITVFVTFFLCFKIQLKTDAKNIQISIFDELIRPSPKLLARTSRRPTASVFFFRADISAFADTFLPDRLSRACSPTRGSRSHESSENNRRRNRGTGLPVSFYSSECFVFSSLSWRHWPNFVHANGTFVFVNPVKPSRQPMFAPGANISLYVPHVISLRGNDGPTHVNFSNGLSTTGVVSLKLQKLNCNRLFISDFFDCNWYFS